jgi:hypothetical protein
MYIKPPAQTFKGLLLCMSSSFIGIFYFETFFGFWILELGISFLYIAC